MELNPVLERFAQRSPLPVMARAVLERCLNAQELDAWFEQVAQAQYTRSLLFSSVYALMTQVVLRQSGSVRAAWLADEGKAGVSLAALYDKLNGLELGTSAALVAYSAERAEEIIAQWPQGRRAGLLEGVAVRMLDGNCLDGRQHRLQATRASTAAPLPGKALAVFDPATETITTLVPCEDGHTQERALLKQVLPQVSAGEVWVADRNFCTTGFLQGLAERGAQSLVREHGLLRFTPLEAMRPLVPEGEGVRALSEQWVQLKAQRDGRPGLKLRRIKVELERATRHGEGEVYLLSTVAPEVADAATLARLYRQRWSIERAFLHLTTELRCEVHTLSYPPAALFALACAVVAFNVLAVLKAALRAAHGAEVEQSLSSHAMASDLRNMGQSLEVIVDAPDWEVFRLASLAAMAAWLLDQARRVSLRRYAKAPARKKPPKPAVKRLHDPKKPHVALSRLLAAQKAASP
jgi:hypothetical protein